MSVWNWMVSHFRGWKLEDHAEDIAIHSLEPVWRRVASRVSTMSLAESRGYVRARGALVLRRETNISLSRSPELESYRDQLLELASDILVDRLERRVYEAQRQSLPRRIAA